jgi:hypothetical protein
LKIAKSSERLLKCKIQPKVRRHRALPKQAGAAKNLEGLAHD